MNSSRVGERFHPYNQVLECRYQEKFYFNPGDTGFQVFETKYAKIGVAICWDQWFPEAARCMALMGAEASPQALQMLSYSGLLADQCTSYPVQLSVQASCDGMQTWSATQQWAV